MRSTVIPAWLLTFAGCAASTLALDAQEAVITVGQHVRVTGEESVFPHFEPHLAVNPTDADNMIAASMVLTGAGARLSIRTYATFDGGESWTHQPIDSHEVGGGDPWLDFSSDGTAYLVHLPGVVRSSTDGGRTWSTPAELPKGEAAADRRAGAFDYPKLVVDKTGGPFDGRVYVSVSQGDRVPSGAVVFPLAVLRSLDQGRSFSFPVHVLPGNFNYQNGPLVVLEDGTVVASFREVDHQREFLQAPRLWVTRSTDGGQSFSTSYLVVENLRAGNANMTADPIGRGVDQRIFIGWAGTQEAGHHLFVVASSDKGETWTEPVRVNDGPAFQRTIHPAMAVNRNGTLVAFWQDTRDDPDGECFTPYLAASFDGGRTFSTNVSLTSEPSCNHTPGNEISLGANSELTVAARWGAGGDYFGLVALPDGAFQALWADSRTGVFQLWTARIEVARGAR